MQYALDISIDSAGLQAIYGAGQSVIVAQVVTSIATASATASSGGLVAWIAFQPLQSNQVTWAPSYSLYATTTPLAPGAAIAMSSATNGPAQPGWLYTFQNGSFSGAPGTGTSYEVLNQTSGRSLSFGLACAATVNGTPVTAPASALPVLFNEQASFAPAGSVLIFPSSVSANGTFLGAVPLNALAVTLTPSAPTANVGFNDATDEFFLVS
jgi:hypothetical protein